MGINLYDLPVGVFRCRNDIRGLGTDSRQSHRLLLRLVLREREDGAKVVVEFLNNKPRDIPQPPGLWIAKAAGSDGFSYLLLSCCKNGFGRDFERIPKASVCPETVDLARVLREDREHEVLERVVREIIVRPGPEGTVTLLKRLEQRVGQCLHAGIQLRFLVFLRNPG